MKRTILVMAAALALALGGCRGDAKPEAQAKGSDSGAGHGAHGHDGHRHDDEDGRDGHAADARGHGGDDHGEDDRHAHDAAGVEIVALAPEAVRAAQIQLVAAERRAFAERFDAPARVAFPQRGVARVGARVPGLLDEVRVEVGDRVTKGAILGWIESPDLGEARAEFLAAATKLRVAEQNYGREKDLLAKGISSEREARDAESAVAAARADVHRVEAKLHTLGVTDEEISRFRAEDHPSARFALRSPIAGTVVEINATAGQSVGGTEPLFVVGDLTRLWVLADIYESQLAAVRTGEAVEVLVPGVPGRTFTGTIEAIGDVVDERTRTISVRIAVGNDDRALKPGMFGTARIAAATVRAPGGAGVVLPREAVQKLGDRQVVFVLAGENRYRPVEVETGAETGGEVEIRAGIDPGTPVVARGAFTLKSELSKESLSGSHAGHGH
jgi:cobalt-zinc-cadmium efflux system membrane fusion protein